MFQLSLSATNHRGVSLPLLLLFLKCENDSFVKWRWFEYQDRGACNICSHPTPVVPKGRDVFYDSICGTAQNLANRWGFLTPWRKPHSAANQISWPHEENPTLWQIRFPDPMKKTPLCGKSDFLTPWRKPHSVANQISWPHEENPTLWQIRLCGGVFFLHLFSPMFSGACRICEIEEYFRWAASFTAKKPNSTYSRVEWDRGWSCRKWDVVYL